MNGREASEVQIPKGPTSRCVVHAMRRIRGLEPHPHQLNASLIQHGGRMLMAYRLKWHNSEIWLCELDDEWRPLWNRRLDIPRGRSNDIAVEDPRLFLHDGRLHVSYVGVATGTRRGEHAISVCYCRLRDDLSVAENHAPHYSRRQRVEKNWQFFEQDGALWAVYSVSPHVVLRIDGSEAHEVYRQDWNPDWSGGLLRGGASPVRRGDSFFCFFHGALDGTGPRTYTLGCYTFDAKPPFRPLQITRHPLLEPDPADQPLPHMAHCVYPCGAVWRRGRWLVSFGYYDHQVWMAELGHASLEHSLAPVGN